MAIKGILNNGEWIEDPVHVKDAFLCHFSTRFQQPAGIPPSLDTDSFTPLSSSKVLANRLRTVIGSCITSVQSAFILGRNILDGPLILNKVLSWYRDRKKVLMVFKVDFEKAFDSLRWDFLDLVMEKLGLHAFICKAEKLGLFKGASIGRDNMNIYHLMYADDVIFFGDASYMANIIGCGVATLPLKYLGVLVGCNMTRCLYWNDIIQKFSSKLSLWKARLLSVGGRLSLTKFVLGNLPTYYMSIFMMPVSIRKKLESMRNKFFIGGDQDEKKMTWVKWKTCLASLATFGLGLFSAFMGPQENGIDLISFCTRKIGNGESTRFWNDVWCGISPLKEQYPRIFLLDTDKDCFISNRVSLPDWHAVLRRVPRGGAEMSQFVALQAALGNVSLTNQCDSWKWSIDGSGSFSVASIRSLVDHHTLDMDQEVTRWNSFIPIKVNVFLWRLKLNKLPSRVNLDRKGIELDSMLCPICHGDVETVNHIFFNCDMAKDLWSLLASWCGGTLLWFIWSYRNHLLFSGSPPKKALLWESIVSQSFLWISSRNPKLKFCRV
ncbi:RNA-directed DNA polymerase, eukaryota, reverse transcriptase zinc-binding domain protein, partial [Tanacetum coccineum]